MSASSWKPTRVGASGADDSAGRVLVEVGVTTPEAKQVLEDAVRASEAFALKPQGDARPAGLLILEIDDDPEKTCALVRTLTMGGEDKEVFLTSEKTDSAMLLEAMRAGMKEFIPQPIQADEVRAALERFQERHDRATHDQKARVGKIISLFGGKGGTGTTSVAVNLAASLHMGPHAPSVALVDVNQHGGDISLYLDMSTSHSFRDIAGDLSRVDLAFLMSVLTKHDTGIHVLPSGYDDLSPGRLNPECVEPTLKLLQSMYEYIVIDCGHVLDLTTKKALEMSSTIIVVSTLLVPVIHRTKRILELLRGSGVSQEKLQLAVCRYHANEKDVLAETEEILKRKADWLIPNDYVAASSAINSGSPVVKNSPKSALSKQYHAMAGSYLPQAAGAPSESFWGNLMGSMKRKKSPPTTAPA